MLNRLDASDERKHQNALLFVRHLFLDNFPVMLLGFEFPCRTVSTSQATQYRQAVVVKVGGCDPIGNIDDQTAPSKYSCADNLSHTERS
jgi:hypothetical protein